MLQSMLISNASGFQKPIPFRLKFICAELFCRLEGKTET